jgi:hypothetical protein
MLADIVERHACRYNRADKKNISSTRVKLTCEHDFALAAVPVTRYLHEATVEWNIQRSDQIRQEDKGVVKNPNDCQLPVWSRLANLAG